MLLEFLQEERGVSFFSSTRGMIKTLLEITRNKKNKHNQVLVPHKSKLNSIETLISYVLIVLEKNERRYKDDSPLSLPECQGTPCSKRARYLKIT